MSCRCRTQSVDAYARQFRSNQVAAVRAARRNNLVSVERGIEGLGDFLPLFQDTYARHGTDPTHSIDEIRDLLERLPEHIRLSLAMRGETPIAGLLLFRVTPSVVCTFYICSSTERAGENGAAFLIADLIERLPGQGVRHLDLGPSASDYELQQGRHLLQGRVRRDRPVPRSMAVGRPQGDA